MIESLISSAKQLPRVPEEAAEQYSLRAKELIDYVNGAMMAMDNLVSLIGLEEALPLMTGNHKNHADFMGTVFSLSDFTLLARTLPWVYRAYTGKGFSFDYFPLEIKAWREACKLLLGQEECREILRVYQWMEENHSRIMAVALSHQYRGMSSMGDNKSHRALLHLLLEGNTQGSFELCRTLVHDVQSLKETYADVLTPVMYKIGDLWESGEISIAQEHLVSAQIVQIMTLLYHQFISARKEKGVLVVATAPNEFHEIPAWMVANSLEGDGWDVQFLGSDTPAKDLIVFLKDSSASGLALSITMSYNFSLLKELIDRIRKDEGLRSLPIAVGGYALNKNPELLQYLDHVSYGSSLQHTLEIARDWKD